MPVLREEPTLFIVGRTVPSFSRSKISCRRPD